MTRPGTPERHGTRPPPRAREPRLPERTAPSAGRRPSFGSLRPWRVIRHSSCRGRSLGTPGSNAGPVTTTRRGAGRTSGPTPAGLPQAPEVTADDVASKITQSDHPSIWIIYRYVRFAVVPRGLPPLFGEFPDRGLGRRNIDDCRASSDRKHFVISKGTPAGNEHPERAMYQVRRFDRVARFERRDDHVGAPTACLRSDAGSPSPGVTYPSATPDPPLSCAVTIVFAFCPYITVRSQLTSWDS